MKRLTKYWIIVFFITAITIVLNLCAFSRSFCNFYNDHVYGIINAVVGTLTSWCPFAMGEIIMYVGGLSVILLVLFAVLLLFLRKKKGFVRFTAKYAKGVLLAGVFFLLIYTVNWFICFRSDVVRVSDNQRTTFSFDEIAYVYGMAVENLNELSQKVERDENGSVVYDYTDEDIIEAMRGISDEFGRFAGHYSKPKMALCSPFLEWMNIGGYNYIYTMEPTYNKYLAPHYFPILLAHEYAHHKGYYKENEGKFFSDLAMVSSDNCLFQYCGYYDIYANLSYDFETAVLERFVAINGELTKENLEDYLAFRAEYPMVSKQVSDDITESYKIADALYESEVPQKLEESFSEASGEISSKGWAIQGEILQENSYDGVVLMLLQYYVN